MNVTTKKCQRGITYTSIEQGANTVCFMLAGSNYLYDKPLLYYATMALLEQGIDVMQVHYRYDATLFEQDVAAMKHLVVADVDAVVQDVLAAKRYDRLLFVGKSLGTIPISFHYAQTQPESTQLVLFTPLLKLDGLYDELMQSANDMLLVIGTNDSHYDQAQMQQLQAKPNVTVVVIDGAKHSLNMEPLQTSASLQAMTAILAAFQHFIRL